MAANAVKIPFTEAAAPSTPAASKVVIYAKSDGLMYSKDDAGTETLMSGGAGGGSVATDAIWDAAGDLVQGTGANTAAKLSAGTAGNFLKSAGAAAANVWAFPPGHELDYVEKTSNTSCTGTSTAAATTIVTANAVAYDGSTVALIEFFCPEAFLPGVAGNNYIGFVLFDGSTELGAMGFYLGVASSAGRAPVRLSYRLTPSNASHTYSVRGYVESGTSTVAGGSGASGARMPVYIRQTKV